MKDMYIIESNHQIFMYSDIYIYTYNYGFSIPKGFCLASTVFSMPLDWTLIYNLMPFGQSKLDSPIFLLPKTK